MAFTTAEENLLRELIAQATELLNLADREPQIVGKLSASKATLDNLPAAIDMTDTDLFLLRQGTDDRKATGSVVKAFMNAVGASGYLATDGSNQMSAPINFMDATMQSSAAYSRDESDLLFGAGQMLGDSVVKAIFFNSNVVDEDLTIAMGTNGGSFGPIEVLDGFEVVLEPDSTWSIV